MSPPDAGRPRRDNTEGDESGAGSTTGSVRQRADDERRERREREFSADVAEFLAALDRRREAARRLQPLADFRESA